MSVVALALLIVSLVSLWRIFLRGVNLRLTGKRLLKYARNHPPKRWNGFEIAVLNVAVDGELCIKAYISGPLIQTPLEISGTPHYDPSANRIFFHVSKATLPRDPARPMIGALTVILNPLAHHIAMSVAEVIPVTKISADTRLRAMFMTSVKDIRVEGNAVVVALHGYPVAAAAVTLILIALLSAVPLLATWL